MKKEMIWLLTDNGSSSYLSSLISMGLTSFGLMRLLLTLDESPLTVGLTLSFLDPFINLKSQPRLMQFVL